MSEVKKGIVVISDGRITSVELYLDESDASRVFGDSQSLVLLKKLVDEAVINLERDEQKKFVPTKDTVYKLP